MKPATLHRAALAAVLAVLSGPIAVLAASGNAEDYFHEGAGLFIKGKNPEALQAVKDGLDVFPRDFHLAELKKVIEEQQQQQQQQDQQKKDQQKQDQNQPKQDQQKQDEKQQDQQNQQGSKDPSGQQEQAQQAPKPSEEMTPEEAKLMLDAVKQQEQANRDRLKLMFGRPVPVDRNW